MTQRYDETKKKLDAITEQISDKKARQATIEEFLKVLQKQEGLITEFQPTLWYGLVDSITIHSADDVRVTFKNGMEIKV